MRSVHALSPAKINLTLDVRPRAQGDFHEIRSVLHKIELSDEIEIQESRVTEVQGNFECEMQKNLAFQALQFVQNFYSIKLPPVKISIQKRIPIAGGLGGGSSNFATVSKLLQKMFQLAPLSEKFVTQSTAFGKDIPFFFCEAPCALATHFGEVIKPLPFNFQNQKLHLFCPAFSYETKDSYARLTNLGTKSTDRFLKNPKLTECGNAFDEFFTREEFQALGKNFSDVHLCGSGSCFWGLQDADFKCTKILTRF